ncbi:MAG: prolyl oligopeptidase family serine peptidase [Planctomyces sp.]|nr:prolyl oligopeptidase family serine peptidase [Planctomyces sp.]
MKITAVLMTAVLMTVVFAGPCVFADGLQDNLPEQVRRIPAAGVAVPEDRANSLRRSLAELQTKIASIQNTGDPARIDLLPDVMIFERAVRCALDYDEFFDLNELDKADALLLEGLTRAEQLLAGQSDWIHRKGLVVRGYISRIDQTVQPYGLVIPADYAVDRSVPVRCDVWFHGRGEKLSEVNFLWDRMKSPGEFTPAHTIVLHPYGRYCNAFKFAGEVDVLEALDDVQRRYRIDEDRISVRGFSMGGAACWQFATHYADRWFAATPGAGFSETPQFLKVFQKEDLSPAPWEKKLWNLYDCNQWAVNLTQCPTIAYSGENDSQKQAADVMEAALASHGIRLRHVIGQGMGHRYDAASKQLIEDQLTVLSKGAEIQRVLPQEIRFQTCTLKYNKMDWITIDGIQEHWALASIRAGFRRSSTEVAGLDGAVQNEAETANEVIVSTDRVTAFTIDLPPLLTLSERQVPKSVVIDGDRISIPQPFSDGFLKCGFVNVGGHWQLTEPGKARTGKRHNLQGPIDDAFMDSFIFVRPTGKSANEAVGRWAESELVRAIEHWRRHFRGDARVVNDVDLTEEMIQSANLVLWGDPTSNSVMAKVADRLPVQWAADTITMKGKSYPASQHAAIMIYPNPLNPDRYVVLNSSFTFREYAYLNNARQVPMLPDWAIIDLNTPANSVWPGKVVDADFFDEDWK